jgi:hypothetical protein
MADTSVFDLLVSSAMAAINSFLVMKSSFERVMADVSHGAGMVPEGIRSIRRLANRSRAACR